MTVALASMFVLALCIIHVFADTTTTYCENGCNGTGAIYPEAGKGAKGTTTNYTSLGNASCSVQVFAILVGGSGIQKAGNSSVGYAEATGYFADVYYQLFNRK